MDYGPLITAAGVAFSGIVGSFLTFLLTRPKAQAEAHGAHAQADYTSVTGFQILVQEMQKERVQLTAVIEKQSARIEEQSTEIAKLRAELSAVKSSLDDVLGKWRRGEAPPPLEPRGNR